MVNEGLTVNALVAAGRKLHAIYAYPPWAFEVYSGKASNGQPNARLSLLKYYINECGGIGGVAGPLRGPLPNHL